MNVGPPLTPQMSTVSGSRFSPLQSPRHSFRVPLGFQLPSLRIPRIQFQHYPSPQKDACLVPIVSRRKAMQHVCTQSEIAQHQVRKSRSLRFFHVARPFVWLPRPCTRFRRHILHGHDIVLDLPQDLNFTALGKPSWV